MPVELLTPPWTSPSNRFEKYWQTVPAAAWAIAQIGQSDQATLAALIERLRIFDDPLWLTGDIVGGVEHLNGSDVWIRHHRLAKLVAIIGSHRLHRWDPLNPKQ